MKLNTGVTGSPAFAGDDAEDVETSRRSPNEPVRCRLDIIIR
jgi:hypothetical protein